MLAVQVQTTRINRSLQAKLWKYESRSRRRAELFSQLLEEQTDRFDPAIEVRDVKLLVGSVQIVVGKTEAHHHGRNLQHVLEVGHDWNRAAGADEDRVFLEDIVQGFGGGLDVFVVGADHAAGPLLQTLMLVSMPFGVSFFT